MYSLSVENEKGEVLELTNTPDYTIYRIEGLNPPPATVNSAANATTDGSKINSVKLENRNIVVYIKPNGDVEANRIRLYKFFATKKNVLLYFNNGSRNVYISGVVDTCELCHFDNPQVMQASIICPDPYFKDIEKQTISFSDVTSLFEFPFSIPAVGSEISSFTLHKRKTVINPSDIETGIVIELFSSGTVVNPILYDVTSGDFIKINLTMQPYDKLIIDTNTTSKGITLIRDGVATNALGYMRPDSKWFTLPAGDNIFAYDCESGNHNLHITFSVSVLYSGV